MSTYCQDYLHCQESKHKNYKRQYQRWLPEEGAVSFLCLALTLQCTRGDTWCYRAVSNNPVLKLSQFCSNHLHVHQGGDIFLQSNLKQCCRKVVTKLSQSCLNVVPTYFTVHQRGDIVVHLYHMDLQTGVNRVIFLQVANRQLAEF